MTDEYKPDETPYDIIAKAYALKPIDATFASFNGERYKAVNAFYEAGYITEEECEELQNHECVRRNECTVIHIYNFRNYVDIACYETAACEEDHMLFGLSFNKHSGVVTELDN